MRLLFYHSEFIIDCNFDQGGCEWVQDKADDMDWRVAYHDDGNRVIHWFLRGTKQVSAIHSHAQHSPSGVEYYMAMSGLQGEQQDQAKLKLLLGDRVLHSSFCLTFDYRVVGRNVGTLRVLLGNNGYPVWEHSHSRRQSWQTELLTVAWEEEAPESVSGFSSLIKMRACKTSGFNNNTNNNIGG